MTYLDDLNQNHPVRNSAEEKSAFRDWAKREAEKGGYAAAPEENEKHTNLVIGQPDQARVIFTAHYDTPRRSLVPNLMLPTNKALFWAYNIGLGVVIALIALLAAKGAQRASGFEMDQFKGWLVWYVTYLVVLAALFKILLLGPKNKHNYNDNTSGTAAVMELARALQGDGRAAFILFDDEEKGKKGSKAYAKAHPDINENKLIINMDCVANGEHFILCASAGAQAEASYASLTHAWQAQAPYTFAFYDAKKIAMNSDQKSFKRGVGICAVHKYKYIGYCTPRIHTKYDTVVSNDNIAYLTQNLLRFTGELQ